MITNNPNPNPNPQYSSNPAPKSGGNKTGFIVAIAILAVAAIGLLVTTISQNKQKGELSSQLSESEQLKKELEQQYYTALSELEEMRGSNEELNALIEKQKEELTAQKDRIDVLLKDSRNLSAARGEMTKLRAQVEQYVAEINQLRQQNEELLTENTQLAEERTMLATDLEMQRSAYQESETVRASLVSEKEELEQTKAKLSSKVTFASVIKVASMDVEGYKTKGTGKMSKERRAKNVDQIQVCFNTTANEVAEPGAEKYHIRIIDPQGTTLQMADMGSGSFRSSSNGDEIPYTMTKEFDYKQNSMQLCSNWAPNQGFSAGVYRVEVYNKGYVAGATALTLK